MFATFIAFGAGLLLLIASIGRPYRQTWYQRWDHDRRNTHP
jgi:hypothetical protein